MVGDHCQTVSYAYRYQARDDVWLLRWEYSRARPRADYAYPLAHLRVNAEFVESAAAVGRLDKTPRICTSRRRACRSNSSCGT